MKYVEFKQVILADLSANKDGFTWKEIRDRNSLRYERPCPTWTRCLEEEIGLKRIKKAGSGNQLVWTL